jgi:hypothetical protein
VAFPATSGKVQQVAGFPAFYQRKSPNGIRAHPPESIGSTIKMMVFLMVSASPLELAPSWH